MFLTGGKEEMICDKDREGEQVCVCVCVCGGGGGGGGGGGVHSYKLMLTCQQHNRIADHLPMKNVENPAAGTKRSVCACS